MKVLRISLRNKNLSNFDKYIPFAKVNAKEIDCKLGIFS